MQSRPANPLRPRPPRTCSLALQLALLLLPLACAHTPTPLRHFPTAPTAPHTSAAAFSPDARLLAVASPDGLLRVFDAHTAQELARATDYVPHGFYTYAPTGLAFSPDNQRLAYAARDHTTHLWSFRANATLKLQGQPFPISAAAFSPDGARLVTAAGGITYPDALNTHPSSALIDSRHATRRAPASATTRPYPYRTPPVIHPITILTHDTTTGQLLSRVDAPGFLTVTLSHDASLFAGRHFPTTPATTWPLTFSSPELHNASNATAPIQVRSTATGQLTCSIPAPAGLFLLLSPDNRYLALGRNVYDIHAGNLVRQTDAPAAAFTDPRHLLCFRSANPPGSLFAPAVPWFRPQYVPLPTGPTRTLGLYENHLAGNYYSNYPTAAHPTLYTPDRSAVLNLHTLTLWRVPR